ncbi:MAG: T9SS type A sorting domain-containing protein [Flavobacteriales bacterium]|nr:T9SS type A sorting domain-containing protein [Flavobacteriales bacterium]
MHRWLVVLLFFSTAMLSAQDWALLNPAYKYNYSNDGTDTISNQIFVTHIDTLGSDSLLYDLNLIGVVCDTCPASLGSSCDGCFVRVGLPQFMGYQCFRSGNDWYFLGEDTIRIKSHAAVGSSWLYDAGSGITATVDSIWSASVFNIQDTLQRIQVSNGGTVLLSRFFGLMRFEGPDAQHDLIGIEGAGIGRLFPGPLDYFDFQPGDHLVYKVSSIWWATPPGGPAFHAPTHFFHEVIIQGRTDLADSVVYHTSVARSNDYMSYTGWHLAVPAWQEPHDVWSFGTNSLLSAHPILGAYPGQILDTSICWWSSHGTRYLAQHGLTADGRSTMSSTIVGQSTWGPTSGFRPQMVAPGLFPASQWESVDIEFEEGLGLRKVEYKGAWLGASLSVELVGAVIAADTILPIPSIPWAVGIEETSMLGFGISPNPCTNEITVGGLSHGMELTIFDTSGRLVKAVRIKAENEKIGISELPPGAYLARANHRLPQRFIIAR